jgi:uncharacterized protein with ATP-grasp and redox domains
MTTADEHIRETVLREALKLAGDMDFRTSPPAMAQQMHRYIRKTTGVEDPYLEKKNHYNKQALSLYPELKEQVENSSDPLETAVRLAIAGNIIDLGVGSTLKEGQVEQTIEKSLKETLDLEALQRFRNEVEKAEDILYLGDNAGEIVFDRLLLEQLPCEKITFVVKGGPVLNDVTIEDAQITGITDLVEVIDNGSDAPGTIINDCSEDFRKRFEQSDLLIIKGQGNFETLNDVKKNRFFLLQPKCSVLAEHLSCKIGSLVLTDMRNE